MGGGVLHIPNFLYQKNCSVIKVAPIFVILPENLNFAGIFARKLEFSPVFLLKMARIFPKKGPYEEVTLKLGHPNCWDGGGQNFQKN